MALNSIITHLQIFGIGFSFGIAGPCFLACTPVLITYTAGSKRTWGGVFKDIITFLSARLLAYVILGALAGLSASLLKKFSSTLSLYSHPLAGVMTIFFALSVLLGKSSEDCRGAPCTGVPPKAGRLLQSGVFAFGFLIGISPCAPLLALLSEIVLMSKGAFDGMLYALSFGLGTFLSGFITVGVIAGVLTRIPAAFIRSNAVNIAFKVICAALLAALGLGLMYHRI